MRRYETIFIIDPDLSEEGRAPIFERLKDLFPQHNGLLVVIDEWGAKKLAYEIKKKARGYYVRLDYCGNDNKFEVYHSASIHLYLGFHSNFFWNFLLTLREVEGC